MRLLLVDGYYYTFRSYYAIRSLSTKSGEPGNAVFGFVKALKRMVADLEPDLGAIIFDDGLPKERMEILPDYKANRTETPEDLEAQVPVIKRVVDALGFRPLSIYGEEADDLMASYAKAARADGLEVILATNDKDIMQMVDAGCLVYQPGKEGFKLLTEEDIEKKWGVPPNKLGDVLALTGDSVDNIPGLPGVGPKTASKLVNKYGSVTAMLEDIEGIEEPRWKKAFAENGDIVRTSQKMVRLRDELELPQPYASLEIHPNPTEQVNEFERLGFKSFLHEAQELLGEHGETPEEGPPEQKELF